jgi:hypothetical protein
MKNILILNLSSYSNLIIQNKIGTNCDIFDVEPTKPAESILKNLSNLKKDYDFVVFFDGDFDIFESFDDKLKKMEYQSVGILCNKNQTKYDFGWKNHDEFDVFLNGGWHGLERDSSFFIWSENMASLKIRKNITNLRFEFHRPSLIGEKLKIIYKENVFTRNLLLGDNTFNFDLTSDNIMNGYHTIFFSVDTFTPKNHDPNSKDYRKLGIKLNKIFQKSQKSDWKEAPLNLLPKFHEMYYDDSFIEWRALFNIDLKDKYSVLIPTNYNIIAKFNIIKHFISNINNILDFVNSDKYTYKNDFLKTIGYINGIILSQQIIK